MLSLGTILRRGWPSGRRRRVPVALLALATFLLAGCGDPQPTPPAPTPWSSPLPHSMKGYELYSWYAAEESAWRHTLITGTDRLKGYDEIVSAQNEVTADGWVALSVVGTGELGSLLGQLPAGEQVFWIDADWLHMAGAEPAIVEAMGLPDDRIVAEIQQLCQEIDVQLHVP